MTFTNSGFSKFRPSEFKALVPPGGSLFLEMPIATLPGLTSRLTYKHLPLSRRVSSPCMIWRCVRNARCLVLRWWDDGTEYGPTVDCISLRSTGLHRLDKAGVDIAVALLPFDTTPPVDTLTWALAFLMSCAVVSAEPNSPQTLPAGESDD